MCWVGNVNKTHLSWWGRVKYEEIFFARGKYGLGGVIMRLLLVAQLLFLYCTKFVEICGNVSAVKVSPLKYTFSHMKNKERNFLAHAYFIGVTFNAYFH
jgi:hypothetical protein